MDLLELNWNDFFNCLNIFVFQKFHIFEKKLF